MPTEAKMTIDERRKYLERMRLRYVRAERVERGQLLDEMEAVTELHRKSLIRLLPGDLARQPRRRERARTYGAGVDDAVRVIAESLDYVCAERLTPNLGWLAQHLAAHGELTLTDTLLTQLRTISISTVQRLLERLPQDQRRLPRKGPERANLVTREIPMKRIAWDIAVPGHFEVDLVHHCGPSASGEYLHSLQMLDVATGWSERVALLGRSYLVMAAAFRRCLARLPFAVLELHPDNGSEFLNAQLVRFWKEAICNVALSRSRPYEKNDNRNVEQKNASLVRAYLGYGRLDSLPQTLAANALYDQLWLYYNLFQPVMHLSEKTVLTPAGHRPHVLRRYDAAQTPFDRLCATQVIFPARREALERLRDQTNPRQLRQEIYAALEPALDLARRPRRPGAECPRHLGGHCATGPAPGGRIDGPGPAGLMAMWTTGKGPSCPHIHSPTTTTTTT